MKQILRFILTITFLLLTNTILLAQTISEGSIPITVGKILSIQSEILDENRQLYVSLPINYDSTDHGYPVVFVLDAEYRFNIAQSIQEYFGLTTRVEPAILVGVANTSRENRNRDLLPPRYGGDADTFLNFIESEVFPFIDEHFETTCKRYLIGHSHGGVFTVYTLLHHKDLFDGYAAIDPSLKYIYSENDMMLNQNFSGKSLYLASSDVAYGYLEDVKADMQNDFRNFVSQLDLHSEVNNLIFKIDHISDDHGNSYIQGFSRGYRYLFNWRFE